MQFGDKVRSFLGFFSGKYEVVEDALISDRAVYMQRGVAQAIIAFCSKERAWTFTFLKARDSDQALDPCVNWQAKSPPTDSYDVTSLPSFEWSIRAKDDSSDTVLFEHFILSCGD